MYDPPMDASSFQPHVECGPTSPFSCDECRAYWDRMRAEGLWVDGKGWTDKAKREWNK